MKTVFIAIISVGLLCTSFKTDSTKYFTREAIIIFMADTPLEKIDAKNNQAVSMLDISTGQLDFAVLMKAFEFDRALMQEHFNENYVESDKFPKASFKGTISNYKDVKWTIDGEYPVNVTGKLSLHGVANEINGKGTVTVKSGQLSATSTFYILISDYNISIPAVVKDKISNKVKIDVSVNYKPYSG